VFSLLLILESSFGGVGLRGGGRRRWCEGSSPRRYGNPLIDGREGRRRMRGRLDVVEHERSSGRCHVGCERGVSLRIHSLVLKTFLRVSKTVTRP
jgi:hypothetical protein